MPYGMSDKDYYAEVKRKEAAGIPLTQPKNVTAYQSGQQQYQQQQQQKQKQQSGGGGGGSSGGGGTTIKYGMTPAQYAQEVNRKYALGIPLVTTLDEAYYQLGAQQLQGQGGGGGGSTGGKVGAYGSTVGLGNAGVQFKHTSNYPGEKMLQQILATLPTYPQYTPEQLQQMATTQANIEVDPYVQALQNALTQAQANAEAQQRSIEAAYATVPQLAEQQLAEARRQALESAIARGAGRSGVVDWATQQATTPIMTATQQAEAEKAASLANVQSQLAATQQQLQQQLVDLEKQRGQLVSQYMTQLQQQGYINSQQDWQNAFNAALQMAQLAIQSQQNDIINSMNVLQGIASGSIPWTGSTSTGFGATGTTNTVPVRTYAAQYGAKVDFNPATKEVIVNGKKFKPQDVGGYIKDGTAYVPENYLRGIL